MAMKPEKPGESVARMRRVLQRCPEAGLHDDSPAVARWVDGMQVLTRQPGGAELASDMPREWGGAGASITPGWYLRAGLASCAATALLLVAAEEGIELSRLEVRATSRSDACGLLGLAGRDGRPVGAGPQQLRLEVFVEAAGWPLQRLHALVDVARRRSPVAAALGDGTQLVWDVYAESSAARA